MIVVTITHGGRTAFGLHNVIGSASLAQTEEVCQIARSLGMSVSRNFVSWSALEPAPAAGVDAARGVV